MGRFSYYMNLYLFSNITYFSRIYQVLTSKLYCESFDQMTLAVSSDFLLDSLGSWEQAHLNPPGHVKI